MSRGYYNHVRDRIRDGDVAVYTSRGRTRYVYHRDGAYFRLVEGRSVMRHPNEESALGACKQLSANTTP